MPRPWETLFWSILGGIICSIGLIVSAVQLGLMALGAPVLALAVNQGPHR